MVRCCLFCNIDISHKRPNAKYCTRAHKIKAAEKRRNWKLEYSRNREINKKRALDLYYKNHEFNKKLQRDRQKRNQAYYTAYESLRRAKMMNRKPKWLTKDDLWLIKEAYELAKLRTQIFNFNWHVDHIIPIQGKIVSGLHVINNLQVIPGSLNISKHNNYQID